MWIDDANKMVFYPVRRMGILSRSEDGYFIPFGGWVFYPFQRMGILSYSEDGYFIPFGGCVFLLVITIIHTT